VNVRRVAALLRELADALDEPKQVRERKRVRAELPVKPSEATMAKVQRSLRKRGIAA
jgi:hypothetical protein